MVIIVNEQQNFPPISIKMSLLHDSFPHFLFALNISQTVSVSCVYKSTYLQ